MKRTLYSLLLGFIALAVLTGWTIKRGPARHEQIIAYFSGYTPVTAAQCGKTTVSLWSQGNCATSGSTKTRVARPWTATRMTGTPGLQAWSGTEGCDLDLLVGGTGGDGTPVALLRAGGGGTDGFRAYETTGYTTTFVDHEIAAGELLQIQHNTPAGGDQYCIAGAGCACTGVQAGYQVVLWGIPH
jgi:hypothetical protein